MDCHTQIYKNVNSIHKKELVERLAEKLNKLWKEHNNSLYVHFG